LDALVRERLGSQYGGRWNQRDQNQRWREHCGWRRNSERELPQPGAIKVMPTLEDGVAVRMEDYYRCLVKNNLAALAGKRSQTNKGMGGKWHDMA
jgi:hypothetical protein